MRPSPWLLGSVFLLNCAEPPTTPPDDPSFELVDPKYRLPSDQITARVYGSFRVNAGGGAMTGVANFPGHPPAGPGTCDKGLWINAQGRATAGSAEKPHPHCIADAVEVVLEPIAACYSEFLVDVIDPKTGSVTGQVSKCPGSLTSKGKATNLILGLSQNVHGFTYTDGHNTAVTQAFGVVHAFAIDGATLNDPQTPPKRVGTLTFGLDQYMVDGIDYFDPFGDGACNLDASLIAPCLNVTISASYTPFPESSGGVGTADQAVEGFLWFAPSTKPYNYDAVTPTK